MATERHTTTSHKNDDAPTLLHVCDMVLGEAFHLDAAATVRGLERLPSHVCDCVLVRWWVVRRDPTQFTLVYIYNKYRLMNAPAAAPRPRAPRTGGRRSGRCTPPGRSRRRNSALVDRIITCVYFWGDRRVSRWPANRPAITPTNRHVYVELYVPRRCQHRRAHPRPLGVPLQPRKNVGERKGQHPRLGLGAQDGVCLAGVGHAVGKEEACVIVGCGGR